MTSKMDCAAAEMARAVSETVNSTHFDKEQIREQKLTLSQALCLLWRDPASGDTCGRRCCYEANAGAAAAVLVDLVVKGKIEVEPSKTPGTMYFKVIDATPTGTYLDAGIYDAILSHHKQAADEQVEIKSWIHRDISKNNPDDRCSTHTLDSMVDLEILEMKTTFGGREYPAIKPGSVETLVKDIRAVALEEAKPSSYLRALLILARTADKRMCLGDPILQKHFSSKEYVRAKERIDGLVGLV